METHKSRHDFLESPLLRTISDLCLRPATSGVIIVSQMRAFSTVVTLAALLSAPAAPAAAQAAQTTSGPADGGAGYYFLLGRHLESEGKIDEAIAAHRKAIELAPASAELRAELAGLYARQDRAREALDTAEAALRIDPANREANRILGLRAGGRSAISGSRSARVTIRRSIGRARLRRSRRAAAMPASISTSS